MRFFLRHQPENLTLVVLSRNLPQLGIANLRVRDQLFDFSEDLKPLSKNAKTSSEQVIEIVDKQALINKRTTSKVGIKQALVPIINNINITKESNENKEGAPIPKINYQFFNNSNSLNQNLAYQYTIPENSFKKRKVAPKKKKNNGTILPKI